jgi:lysophospholipid acyltransferase (LPLAT)-like uncharacterized protein
VSTPSAEIIDDDAVRDVQDMKHPWHFRLLVRVGTTLAAVLVWCWFKTLRTEVINGAQEKARRKQQAVVYASWHRGVLFALYFWRWEKGWLLASASKDGEWATGLIKRFGNFPIRGSSSRGGRAAIKQMVECLKSGVSGGLVPDAPKGPAGTCKAGALIVAQRAGAPIIPATFAAHPCIRLKSWDRTILPLPFARFVAKFGEPFYVDPSLEGEEFEARRKELEQLMDREAAELDAYLGMKS